MPQLFYALTACRGDERKQNSPYRLRSCNTADRTLRRAAPTPALAPQATTPAARARFSFPHPAPDERCRCQPGTTAGPSPAPAPGPGRRLPRSGRCCGRAAALRSPPRRPARWLRSSRRSPRRRRAEGARAAAAPGAAAGVCRPAWPWPAGSAGAGRRFAGAPAPGAPGTRPGSGTRRRCGAAGRARCAGGAAPSPRCAAAPRTPPWGRGAAPWTGRRRGGRRRSPAPRSGARHGGASAAPPAGLTCAPRPGSSRVFSPTRPGACSSPPRPTSSFCLEPGAAPLPRSPSALPASRGPAEPAALLPPPPSGAGRPGPPAPHCCPRRRHLEIVFPLQSRVENKWAELPGWGVRHGARRVTSRDRRLSQPIGGRGGAN